MFYANRDEGFTLVEVLLSLVIFLVASMGLLPLLLTNIQANQNQALQTRAQRLAGEVMTQLQVIDYLALEEAASAPLLVDGVEIRQQVEQGLPGPGQSRITVTASWQHRGRAHRYQLQMVRSAP